MVNHAAAGDEPITIGEPEGCEPDVPITIGLGLMAFVTDLMMVLVMVEIAVVGVYFCSVVNIHSGAAEWAREDGP